MDKNNFISNLCGISLSQVSVTTNLLDQEHSIPFIARYRKEKTKNLDELEIGEIKASYKKYNIICKQQLAIIDKLSKQNDLTEELKNKIESCYDLTILDDLYLPYKKKRTSKIDSAKKAGLENLAKIIMKQDNTSLHIEKFKSVEFSSIESVTEATILIISEWINENALVREKLRSSFIVHGVIYSKKIKNNLDKDEKYKDLYEYTKMIKHCPPHRILALLRAEHENIIRVKVSPNEDYSIQWLERLFIKNNNDKSEIVKHAIKNVFKKQLMPQLSTETKQYYKTIADEKSIELFSKNLKKILLTAPLGEKRILAIDPGFKTGCKVVCLDQTGKLLHNETVFPHPPQRQKLKASSKIAQLVEIYKIDAIAIGDGTAGRESENWIKHIRFSRDLLVFMVREDGASIYSASKIAREEFPEYDITVRGAVSIGRRLMDPLSELVKIEPKSLGVGQYQHDVNQLKLKEGLDQVVENVVNAVGVNLNTASKYLLKHVSGIGEKTADEIIKYRIINGEFKSKMDLLEVPKLGSKTFEQAAGFLRIKNQNPLDNTGIHPEQYKSINKIANTFKVSIDNLIGNHDVLTKIIEDKNVKLLLGEYTLKDVYKELSKPGVDPRKKVKIFEFSPGIKTISDLKIGMKINGIVTNVTDFGAFVNIGIKQNGLIHKTEMSDNFIEHPIDVLNIDDHVLATVILLDIERKRIGLTLK